MMITVRHSSFMLMGSVPNALVVAGPGMQLHCLLHWGCHK